MADYTPTTEELREAIVHGIADRVTRLLLNLPVEEARDIVQEGWDRWLATVTPNPADARQVEVVARVIHDDYCYRCATGEPNSGCITEDVKITARAVLTALAAEVGRG